VLEFRTCPLDVFDLFDRNPGKFAFQRVKKTIGNATWKGDKDQDPLEWRNSAARKSNAGIHGLDHC
jgi:hypothetical protein